MAKTNVCCCDAACWVKIRQCCGVFFDQVYVPCTIANRAGIPATGAFLWNENCWEVEAIVGTRPPAGALIVGDEIVGAIRATYDHCQEEFPGDPEACCHSRVPGCWYVAIRCCTVTLPSCDLGLHPPDVLYIDCADIDPFVESGSVSFPYTFKPTSLASLLPEQCVACYTIDGDTVSELPADATVLGSIEGQPAFESCEDDQCCPAPSGEPCPAQCSHPTHVIFDIVPTDDSSGGCPCDKPQNPQAWLVGNFQGAFSCNGQTAVSDNGCKLRYEVTFACNFVTDGGGNVVAIYYRTGITFKSAATIGPNDPDCGACGYTFPGLQTCVDPCPADHTYLVRTPDLPPGTCPQGSQFTIVETFLNLQSASVVGFIGA